MDKDIIALLSKAESAVGATTLVTLYIRPDHSNL